MSLEKPESKFDREDWPFVSMVMVNLNGEKWLKKFFKSFLDSDYPQSRIEIIVVDNGSTDGSVKFLSKEFGNDPRVRIIENEKNLGYASAINRGLRIARGEVLACLTNDIEADPAWIREIVKVMISDPKIGIIQPRILSVWDKKTLDSGLNYLDKFGYAYSYMSSGPGATDVTFAEGVAWVTKSKVIEDIGMLDEYYFMEYDDQDISWRCLLAGYRVSFVPSAIVYHVRGGTQGKTFFDRLRNTTWYVTNHIATLIKNYELTNILRVLPIVVTVELAKASYLIAKRRRKFAFATLKGLFIVLKDLRLVLQKRWEIQHRVRKVSDKEVMKYMVPFSPMLLISFLTSQARGKRFISSAKPATSR